MIAISTSSMTQANGNAPVKMCDSVIDGSRMVLLMVYQMFKTEISIVFPIVESYFARQIAKLVTSR